MMGSRIHSYIRYAPLLLLCAFPHHVFLVGSMDCVTGIVIASYAIIAVPMGNMAACGEPRCNRVLNAALPTFAVVFLVAISWFPGVREFAFFALFAILCFDRLACLCSSGESMAVRFSLALRMPCMSFGLAHFTTLTLCQKGNSKE